MAEAGAPATDEREADERRVLVVDDEPNIADVLVMALEDEGYAVRTASDGRQALDVLRHWPPHVVLLDLMLPVLDGWSLLEEWQRQGLAPQARVVVVSAARRPPPVNSPRVAAIIPKPFDLNRVLVTVARLVSAA
jgi:two-component system OmpR family response regulator